ncbi:MAG: AzlD family protein [Desulfonatronovibrio sp.]
MTDSQDLLVLVTIICMTAATYFTRAGGLFIVSRITPSPRVRAFLNHVPASILVAIIVPTLAGKGPAEIIAASMAALAAVFTRNLIISLLAGLVTVSLLRNFIFI